VSEAVKYRKKPVVIEAMQFLGPVGIIADLDQAVAFDGWIVANQGDVACRYRGDKLIIPTLEGEMEASPGDWIIKGVKGELYPCKPDIFEATYELTH
jgi:hypothetical protein